MSRFQYRALDSQDKVVDGTTIADSTSQAIAKLERSGYKVQSISLVDSTGLHWDSLPAEERASIDQIRERAVRNAQSWADPLMALSLEIKSRWLSGTLSQLSHKLKNATSIEQLASDRDIAEVLPFVTKQLDTSNESEDWLLKLTQQLEMRRGYLQSLFYPIVSALFLGVISVVGAIWIIPIFRHMYDEFGLTLPAITKLVFVVSSWIYPNALQTLIWLAIGSAVVLALVRWARKSEWMYKNFPLLFSGNRASLRAVGLLCKNTAELLQLQYPLPQALKLSAQGCNHNFYKSTASKLSDELEDGLSVSRSLQLALPPMLLGALNSGTADVDSLRRLGGLYRDRECGGSQQFVFVLSHIMVACSGLMVGFVAIALFMPLVRMVTSLA